MHIEQPENSHVFRKGEEILEKRGVCIIGMSPGNGYFKSDTVRRLLAFCSAQFRKSIVMIADAPAVHTYRAMGYPETKAQRKARLNGNNLQNNCKKAIAETGQGITLVEWSDEITPRPEYQESLRDVRSLYRTNRSFRSDARETTRAVLEGKTKEGVNMEEAIDEGVLYLLKELAYLLSSPALYGDEIAYIYHDRWPVFEKLANGEYDGRIKGGIGYVIARD